MCRVLRVSKLCMAHPPNQPAFCKLNIGKQLPHPLTYHIWLLL